MLDIPKMTITTTNFVSKFFANKKQHRVQLSKISQLPPKLVL
jgi:hypothetical protein